MFLKPERKPSERALGSLWPEMADGRGVSRSEADRQRAHLKKWQHAVWEWKNGYRSKEPPPFKLLPPLPPKAPPREPKSEAERETALREKWGNPQHAQTKIESGDARHKDFKQFGPRRQYVAPTPEEHGQATIANPVSFYGPASKGVPREWGPGLGGSSVREYTVERAVKVAPDGKTALSVETRTLAKPVVRHRRFDPDKIDRFGNRGVWADCAESQAEVSIHVGWKGGGERISTKQGDRTVYKPSDKLPCHGSDARAKIIRDTEVRFSEKKGEYLVETFRSKCPACGIVRDVPHKIAKATPAPETWTFPEHQGPTYRVDHVRNREVEGYPQIPAIPDLARVAPLAVAGSLVGDTAVKRKKAPDGGDMFAVERDPTERGLMAELRLYRGAIAAGVPIEKPIYYAVEDGRIVEKRGIIYAPTYAAPDTSTAAGRAEAAKITRVDGRPVANGRIAEWRGLSEIELRAAQAKLARPANRPALCDPRKPELIEQRKTIVAF